jgi:S-adenosylmethionine decarboxylase proenzyme
VTAAGGNPTFAPVGLHAVTDVAGIEPGVLNDGARLRDLLRAAVVAAGATVRHEHVEQFDPSGVSVVLVLAESHASVHTYPEAGVALADVFTCGDTIDPGAALAAFTRALGSGSVHPRLLRSGVLDRGAIVFRGRGDARPLPDAGTLTGRPSEDP